LKYGFLYNTHPSVKLIFAALFAFASFLLFFIIGVIIAIPVFKIDIFQLPAILIDVNNPENLALLKYLQINQSIGLFIIPSFFIAYFIYRDSFEYLCLNRSSKLITYILIIILIFVLIPLINFIAEINSHFHLPDFLDPIERWMKEAEDTAQDLTEAFLMGKGPGDLIINLIMVAVLPAIGEELLFRGIIQRLFLEWIKNVHIAILISAILFSALHLQFYGFLPRLMLGILFGYLFVWSGTIWLPIFAHFLNNGIAVVFYYLLQNQLVTDELETLGTQQQSILFVLLSAVLVSLVLIYFPKKNKIHYLQANQE